MKICFAFLASCTLFFSVLPPWVLAAQETGNAVAAPQDPPAPEAPSSTLSTEAKAEVISMQDLLKVRDPFQRPVTKLAKDQPNSELETFPLSEFRVIGILRGLGSPRAMLVAPSGKTYFVRENQRIGVRKGTIARIGYESVVVRERVVNILGKEETYDVDIDLAPEFTKEVTSSRSQSW